MIWDGSTVYTLWGYRPVTAPSIKWIRKADGNWSASDRGASEDVYEAEIVFRGPEAELNDLESVLDSNKENFSITCGTGEEIFGADIDYSGSLDITVVDYSSPNPSREDFAFWTMGLKLRLFSPSFVGTAGSLSTLKLSQFSYDAYSEFDNQKVFTYDGTAYYNEEDTEPGIFSASFKQTQSQAEAIRRYILSTNRSGAFTFPSIGVDYPFGQRAGTGPFSVKIIEWNDEGRPNLVDWFFRIKFARVFT